MNKLYAFLFFNFLASALYAQINQGARFGAMANAGVALQDVWSAQNNQAGLGALESPQFSASYENKYGIKELSTKAAVVAIPLKNFVIGAAFNTDGFDAFSETKVGLSLARAYGDKLFIALNANYHQIKIQNYGNAQAFTVEAGIQYKVTTKLLLASHISNPNQSKYGENTEQIIPANISFGANYLFAKKLLLCGEVIQSLDAEVDFKSGLEYALADFFVLRGGISVNSFKQYIGFGLNYQKIKLDFAVASHPILGYSPQISLGYAF